MICNTYYGGFRTRTFADIYPSFEAFKKDYESNPLKLDFSKFLSLSFKEGYEDVAKNNLTLESLYYMLYAHYGNSHIAYSDENQFKFYLYSIIYQHAPAVIKKREIQLLVSTLEEEEIRLGSRAIYNHAFNPSTEPGMQYAEGLPFINDQNTTNYKKSILEGFFNYKDIIGNDVIDLFIHKFKRLFITVLAPDYPLTYISEVEDD